ncbi:hypothetical protein LG293_16465 (plasmid) [Citricoccus nitrophenolicus]
MRTNDHPSAPVPGQLWQVAPPGVATAPLYAVLHSGDTWSVLARSHGELTLAHLKGLTPVRCIREAGHGWAAHFDALCQAAGLDVDWTGYVTAIRDRELARHGADPIPSLN